MEKSIEMQTLENTLKKFDEIIKKRVEKIESADINTDITRDQEELKKIVGQRENIQSQLDTYNRAMFREPLIDQLSI